MRPAPACLNIFAVAVDSTQAEELGFDTPAKCKKCQACTTCIIQEQGPSFKEKMEHQMLKDAVHSDPDKQKMIVRPDFLFQDRKNWPLSRDFVRQKRDLIPAKEKRKRFCTVLPVQPALLRVSCAACPAERAHF